MTKSSPGRVERRANTKPNPDAGAARIPRTHPPSFAAGPDEAVAEQLEIVGGLARLVTIGPRGAAQLLACRYEGQRPLIPRHVEMLTAAIQKGLWVCNGDPIIISDTGRLLNGQNRMDAIRRAKLAVQCLVLEGMSEEAFGYIDGLRAERSTAFRLGIPQRMASDLTLIFAAQKGQRGQAQNGFLESILIWWRPIYDALASVIPAGTKQKMNNGVIRLACGLRWAMCNDHEERTYVLNQFAAISRLAFTDVSPAVGAMLKVALDWGASMNHQENMRRAAFVFENIAPERRDNKRAKHQVDVAALVRWIASAESAFKAERVADVHPFRFGDAPVIDTELRGPEKVRSRRVRPDDAPEDRPLA